MKSVSSYANIFNEDFTYIKFKNDFLKNERDERFVRKSKEAFKCVFAKDFINLIQKASLFPQISKIPDFIYELLSKGKYCGSVKTIKCIFLYCINKNVWSQYSAVSRKYTPKIKNNANHKFGVYFKQIYSDAKKELKSYKRSFNTEQINEYRFALIFFNIVIRTFYLNALPKHISPSVFEKCRECDKTFSNYYKFDPVNNIYNRIKYERKAARYFNENVAWWLVYNSIVHYGLNKK